jgi:hypothetical protein
VARVVPATEAKAGYCGPTIDAYLKWVRMLKGRASSTDKGSSARGPARSGGLSGRQVLEGRHHSGLSFYYTHGWLVYH